MSEAINPMAAPELPELPEGTKRGLGHTVSAVVYWSLMIFGIGIPPLLGLWGQLF